MSLNTYTGRLNIKESRKEREKERAKYLRRVVEYSCWHSGMQVVVDHVHERDQASLDDSANFHVDGPAVDQASGPQKVLIFEGGSDKDVRLVV